VTAAAPADEPTRAPVPPRLPLSLTLLGDSDAAAVACEGDACLIPATVTSVS
jgi:hypothetical protein